MNRVSLYSLLEEQNGPQSLEKIVTDFYDQVFSDVMIGFFFFGKNKKHLIQKEIELISELLGGPENYQGVELEKAHRHLKIFKGHFDRRVQILKETLEKYSVPKEVKEVWLTHSKRLHDKIISKNSIECSETKKP